MKPDYSIPNCPHCRVPAEEPGLCSDCAAEEQQDAIENYELDEGAIEDCLMAAEEENE